MVADRNAFGLVLLLLRLQGELDEELLQFLVAVVDAKLFKAAERDHGETRLHLLTHHTSESKDFKWLGFI